MNEETARRRTAFAKAEIINDGETDARDLSVIFYRGEQPDKSRTLYETLIPTLAAQSTETLTYEWNFGQDPDPPKNREEMGFWVEAFRSMLFARVVPNLKRLGLISPRVREAFERLQIIQFEDFNPEEQDRQLGLV